MWDLVGNLPKTGFLGKRHISISVSVTKVAWFEESRRFLIAFSDGVIYQSSPSELDEPIRTEAHEVSSDYIGL